MFLCWPEIGGCDKIDSVEFCTVGWHGYGWGLGAGMIREYTQDGAFLEWLPETFSNP